MNRMRNVSTGGPVNAPKGTSTRRPKGASRTTTATQGDGSTDSPLPAASEDAPAGTSAEQATAPTEASRSGAAGSDESTVAERPSVPERPTVAERPAVVGAALAAGWVAASGAIVCAAVAVIGWFGADGGTAGHAVSVGFDIWLLAHGAAIAFSDGSFSLVPLGLTGIVALVLARAGRWVATSCVVRGPRDVAAACATLAVVYGVFGAVLAAAARTAGAGPSSGSAALSTALIALLAGGYGMTRATGLLKRGLRMLPVEVRAVLAGALTGLGLLLGAGLLLTLGALVANFSRFTEMLAELRPGPVGGTLLVVACVLYLPNAAVWAAAYALGPGFSLGSLTVVAPSGVVLGELPVFPLLAAVPTSPPSAWGMTVFLLPMGAGLAAGWVAGRGYVTRGLRGGRWRRPNRPDLGRIEQAALRGGLAGAVAGLGYAVCAVIASGSVGPGRMSEVGTAPLRTTLVAMLTFGIAAAVAATIDHIRIQLRSSPDAPRPE